MSIFFPSCKDYFFCKVNMVEFTSCLKKQAEIKALFDDCLSMDAKYVRIMEQGRLLPSLDPSQKIKENLVSGCQSIVYLHAYLEEGLVVFNIESDALISSGLASLLVQVYSGETPETILKCPPTYLEELGIGQALTPNRANGLYSIHLRMKQEALKLLVQQH
jgi:cysteine desulfuration protein SufE